jgi:hypothetical protein
MKSELDFGAHDRKLHRGGDEDNVALLIEITELVITKITHRDRR